MDQTETGSNEIRSDNSDSDDSANNDKYEFSCNFNVEESCTNAQSYSHGITKTEKEELSQDQSEQKSDKNSIEDRTTSTEHLDIVSVEHEGDESFEKESECGKSQNTVILSQEDHNQSAKEQKIDSNVDIKSTKANSTDFVLRKDETCAGSQESEKQSLFPNKSNESKMAFLNLIEKLGLQKFYPDKMTLMDIMRIRSTSGNQKFTDIPWIFLKNIIMINFTSRDQMVQDYLNELSSQEIPQNEPQAHDDDDDDDFLSGDKQLPSGLNPLDLMVVVFNCSSPTLKSILATKLFVCKLAMPCVFPPIESEMMMSFWLLRSIVMERKLDQIRTWQSMAVDCPCNIVSFFRLGRPATSKSKLINEILSDQCHETFFNINCPLGKTARLVSDGLIEAAWYTPSGKSDILNCVTMFLNLRGDGDKYSQQLELLSQVSSVVVVVLESSHLKHTTVKSVLFKFHQSVSGVLIAVDGFTKDKEFVRKVRADYLQQIKEHKKRTKFSSIAVDRQYTTPSDLKKDLRKKISDLLKNSETTVLSGKLSEENQLIKIDEYAVSYRKAREKAEIILHSIPGSHLKEEFVPLQGITWNTWSNHLKDINKASKFTSLHERGLIETKMKEERKQQLTICRNLSSFMKLSLQTLLSTLDEDDDFLLLVDWLKLLLDDRSRALYSDFLLKYNSARQDVRIAKQEQKGKEIIEKLEKVLSKSKSMLNEVSFKFEHIMRELGQMYEAFDASKSNITDDERKVREKLPQIGAKMLLLGQPFEILDGDASNVPLSWVEAVLSELRGMIGDKKMLALSVVGIQSSGKSTLLNTMFGLQFAVSAGRCTRGVFMQLVPVQANNLPFDYVAVIDAEGLRAPEQAANQMSHDNKLATFVIGLGDVVIVNVKGENTTEVKDILQISVHAFLRLKLANKRLNLKQSCVFVHQNVPAADAGNKMIEERRVFVETLDEMTKEAAEQENIADTITFSQVIDFDCDENVSYFSDLWRGDPPMAPANPGYSRRVAEVKDSIIFKLASKRETYLTITDTIARLKDLWKGILKDDFVYSFRNSLELKAYNSMERKYHAVVWKLEKFACEFVLSRAKTDLLSCNSGDESELAVSRIVLRLSKDLDQQMTGITKELESFIDKNPLKEVMNQWKQSKLVRLKNLSVELIMKSKTQINNIKEEIRIERLRTREKTNHEVQVNELARSLACKMKGESPSEEVLSKQFESMWISWINKFDTKHIEDSVSVSDQIKGLIYEKFPSDVAFMESNQNNRCYNEMTSLTNSITFADILDEYISVKNLLCNVDPQAEMLSVFKRQAVDVTNKLFRKIDVRLHELNKQDVQFDNYYVSEILHIILSTIDDHNESREDCRDPYNFTLTSPYRAMIIDHVVQYATVVFTTLNDRYKKKHSPRGQMEEYKRKVWDLFKNLMESKTEDMITIGFLKSAIVTAVTKQVSEVIPLDVRDKVLLLFNHEKYSVMKAIMIELAAKDNFDEYKAFIQDQSTYARKWITDFTYAKIFDENVDEDKTQYALFAEARIDTIFTQLSKSIPEPTHSFEADSNIVISPWIDLFREKIAVSDVLPLSLDILRMSTIGMFQA